MKQDVALELLGPCNYSCKYCIGDGPANRYPTPTLHNLEWLREIYSKLGSRGEVSTMLSARGTEPALHPQMREIAAIVTQVGVLHCSTNLSRPVCEWLPGPHNMWLLVTIHPEAEADLPGFMERVRDAVEHGYDVQVQALGDRDRPEWRAMLVEAGITRPFKVLKIRIAESIRAKDKEIAASPPGSLCRAGYDSFYITAQTNLQRCRVKNWTGGPFDAPHPCPQPQADSRCVAYLVKET